MTDHITCLVVLSSIVLLIVVFPDADAAPQTKKIIGINIETTLIKSGKLGYSDILSYDRSDKRISGDFVKSGNDIVRKCAKIQNNISYYSQQNKLIILVDPCFTQKTYIPMITIVSRLDHYTMYDQHTITENKTAPDLVAIHDVKSFSHTRYVNPKCTEATIGYSENWRNVLNDTINYMTHQCDPAHTKIKTITTEYTVKTKHQIATSAKYKLDSFYDYIKQNCTKSRNACTDINNKAVTTNGDVK